MWGGAGNDEVTGDLAADMLDGGPGFDHGYGGPPGREGADVIVSVSGAPPAPDVRRARVRAWDLPLVRTCARCAVVCAGAGGGRSLSREAVP